MILSSFVRLLYVVHHCLFVEVGTSTNKKGTSASLGEAPRMWVDFALVDKLIIDTVNSIESFAK